MTWKYYCYAKDNIFLQKEKARVFSGSLWKITFPYTNDLELDLVRMEDESLVFSSFIMPVNYSYFLEEGWKPFFSFLTTMNNLSADFSITKKTFKYFSSWSVSIRKVSLLHQILLLFQFCGSNSKYPKIILLEYKYVRVLHRPFSLIVCIKIIIAIK